MLDNLNTPQPAPVSTARSLDVWPAIYGKLYVDAEVSKSVKKKELADIMRDRDMAGRGKYGCPLQSHNGRNAKIDALQEALDLVAYTYQVFLETNKASDYALHDAALQLCMAMYMTY